MLGKPLVADESEMRQPVAVVRPRDALHEHAHDSDAEEHPHDSHRHPGFLFLFAMISRVLRPQQQACAKRHSRLPTFLLVWRSCHDEMAIATKWRSSPIPQGSKAQITPSSARSGADAWTAEAR